MNRREFLKSFLGAAAVAAMPATALALAEKEAAPLADAFETWTPSNYMFSIWVKRLKVPQRSAILGADGSAMLVDKPTWERHAFSVSKEIADAMSGKSANSEACWLCIQRVLKTIGQEEAEMCNAQLEQNINGPSPYFSVDWSNDPTRYDGARRVENKMAFSDTRTNMLLYSNDLMTKKDWEK